MVWHLLNSSILFAFAEYFVCSEAFVRVCLQSETCEIHSFVGSSNNGTSQMPVLLKMKGIVNVVLRVPLLFLVHELLRIRLGLGVDNNDYSSYESDNSVEFSEQIEVGHSPPVEDYDYLFYKTFRLTVFKVFLSCLGIIMALCMFMLLTKHLVVVYMYLISVGIVFVSYWCNVSTMRGVISVMTANGTSSKFITSCILEDIMSMNFDKLFNPGECAFMVIQNTVKQSGLAFVFIYVHRGPRYSLLQTFLPLSFLAPSFLAMSPMCASVLNYAPAFAALVPFAAVTFVLWGSTIPVVQMVYGCFKDAWEFANNFGVPALFEMQWLRLNVATILRTFWVLRVAAQARTLIFDNLGAGDAGLDFLLSFRGILNVTKSLLASGCETQIDVLGMTSVVSCFCHYIYCVFRLVLHIEDEDRNAGTYSAVYFYALALQARLTELNPQDKLLRMYKNFWVLSTNISLCTHKIVNPLLVTLSASHNPSLHRHIRALLVCTFLILSQASLLAYLWSQYTMSTWLLAVSALSLEVIVTVVVSLMIYSLFIIEDHCSLLAEKLDDYEYNIRAFGGTVRFSIDIVLLFNGMWIIIFESGGIIRTIFMCIHAYFNVWIDAVAGWMAFTKRRTAVNIVNSLPEAGVDQLQQLNDVCPICYHEMKTAKITGCNHFFHSACLKKWLHGQNHCPMCYAILYTLDDDSPNASEESSDE